MKPFMVETGPIGAFTAAHDDPATDAAMIQYVSTFVPKMSGENFNPHVSTGVAPPSTSTKCSPSRLSRSPSRRRARPFISSARSARRRRNSKSGICGPDQHLIDWDECHHWPVTTRCNAARARTQTDHIRHSSHDRTVKFISRRETFFGETSTSETDGAF